LFTLGGIGGDDYAILRRAVPEKGVLVATAHDKGCGAQQDRKENLMYFHVAYDVIEGCVSEAFCCLIVCKDTEKVCNQKAIGWN
jgi:hypothetical protein